MSSTVDNISANIDAQFNIIGELLEIYAGAQDKPALTKTVAEIKITVYNLLETYTSSTVGILLDYYSTGDDSYKAILHDKFVKEFHSSNIVGNLKRTMLIINRLRKTEGLDDSKILELIKRFDSINIDESFQNSSADICVGCKTPYDIEEKTAEFTCKTCGHIEKMYGVVFEVEQLFYQEGQRTKHGKYDPIKHAKFWLDRIQAKENTDIPEAVINAVKRCIRRDQLWIHKIDCETVRSYLKQIKMTSYNNHVALIRKQITGIEPDQLSDYEVRLIYMYFSTVIQIFNKIKGDDKSNCPYHPFFIYKIIEQILKHPKDIARKRNILSCIHLQSRDTLIENDKVWFNIVDEIPDFTKIATDGGTR